MLTAYCRCTIGRKDNHPSITKSVHQSTYLRPEDHNTHTQKPSTRQFLHHTHVFFRELLHLDSRTTRISRTSMTYVNKMRKSVLEKSDSTPFLSATKNIKIGNGETERDNDPNAKTSREKKSYPNQTRVQVLRLHSFMLIFNRIALVQCESPCGTTVDLLNIPGHRGKARKRHPRLLLKTTFNVDVAIVKLNFPHSHSRLPNTYGVHPV